MLDRILIPLDGSATAEKAIPYARAIAQVFDSRVSVVRVMDSSGWVEPGQTVDTLRWQLQKTEISCYLSQAAQQLSRVGVDAHSILLEGRTSERLVEETLVNPVDLIVLTAHGHSSDMTWPLGSVAHKIIARAPASKLVIRGTHSAMADMNAPEGQRFKRIVLPLDGSWRAECVLPLAARLVQAYDAELIVVHAVPEPEMARRAPLSAEEERLTEGIVRRNRAEAERYMEQLAARLPVEFTPEIVNSPQPAAALLRLTERSGADLVLLCAHGLSGNLDQPMGTIAQRFAEFSPAPVLIYQDVPAMFASNGNHHADTSERASTPRRTEMPKHA